MQYQRQIVSLNMNLFNNIDGKIDRIFHAKYVKHARVLLIMLLVVLFLPIVLTQIPITVFDFTESGQIGDTIGGITSPFIGIIAGYLTFLAFHEQYRANEKATKDLEKERFESKFYNFLSLLNTLEINTSIPNVGNYKQAFHYMFYEFKSIAILIHRKWGKPNLTNGITNMTVQSNSAEECTKNGKDIREELLKEAFGIFINGVSQSATSRMKEYINGSETMNDYFFKLQNLYSNPENPNVPYLGDYETINIKLFDGHRLRLISFFRMICKIIELIYEDGKDNKELYLSTLLSLLSEHQIALLKLMYMYDKDQNMRFIMKHEKEIESFFLDPYYKDIDNDKVCISKFIFSETLDCTKEGFINYNNQVGEFPIVDKQERTEGNGSLDS